MLPFTCRSLTWPTATGLLLQTSMCVCSHTIVIVCASMIAISLAVKRDICKPKYLLDLMNIQTQPHDNDCGVFVVA